MDPLTMTPDTSPWPRAKEQAASPHAFEEFQKSRLSLEGPHSAESGICTFYSLIHSFLFPLTIFQGRGRGLGSKGQVRVQGRSKARPPEEVLHPSCRGQTWFLKCRVRGRQSNSAVGTCSPQGHGLWVRTPSM